MGVNSLRNDAAAQHVARQMQAAGGEAIALQADVGELEQAALWLASGGASYVHGGVIDVAGGR